LPAVLGHEGAGVIEAVGAEVTHLAPGDHVVLGFAACRRVAQCDRASFLLRAFRRSQFRRCRSDGTGCLHDEAGKVSSHFFGHRPLPAMLVAPRNVVKVDKDVPLEILGPLGCGIMTGAGTVFMRWTCRKVPRCSSSAAARWG
jgi:aryl-alcohol dehydrogenase